MKQLRNITEDFVRQYVETHISETEVCQCEDCRMDIMAIMLNKMPPHYVVTETGELFAQLQQFDFQHAVDITVAMAEAVEVVRKLPRHAGRAPQT